MAGGVLISDNSAIIIGASELHDNSATWGGVLYSQSSTITIEESELHDNSAHVNYFSHSAGGVLDSSSSTITIEASEFTMPPGEEYCFPTTVQSQ